jgi:hypothetical protein
VRWERGEHVYSVAGASGQIRSAVLGSTGRGVILIEVVSYGPSVGTACALITHRLALLMIFMSMLLQTVVYEQRGPLGTHRDADITCGLRFHYYRLPWLEGWKTCHVILRHEGARKMHALFSNLENLIASVHPSCGQMLPPVLVRCGIGQAAWSASGRGPSPACLSGTAVGRALEGFGALHALDSTWPKQQCWREFALMLLYGLVGK